MHLSSGGGEKIHSAFATLNYIPTLKEMVSADPLLFPSSSSLQRETVGCVVATLLAAEDSGDTPDPTILGAEGEGGTRQKNSDSTSAPAFKNKTN